MPTKDALSVFLRSLDAKSYYQVLRVAPDADARAVKTAFHEFSLLYHPDRFVGLPPDAAAVASEIYKRGVEAYRCLSRPAARARYDRALSKGRLRLDPSRRSTPPPTPVVRTLEMVAQTPRGKQLALKADRL